MSYIALYQGTASEAAEKVRNADSSWAEAHSEWQEERTCTAHLKVRPFKTHGKCLFSAASEAAPLQSRMVDTIAPWLISYARPETSRSRAASRHDRRIVPARREPGRQVRRPSWSRLQCRTAPDMSPCHARCLCLRSYPTAPKSG